MHARMCTEHKNTIKTGYHRIQVSSYEDTDFNMLFVWKEYNLSRHNYGVDAPDIDHLRVTCFPKLGCRLL